MECLSDATVRLISSTQVITSVFSAVKELIENSLDANATSIEVKLENYGLEKIEVRDNGIGIKSCHIHALAKPHYTSKITIHDDLLSLSSYGFRGEALASLCSVAELSVTTKTPDDKFSLTYNLTEKGDFSSSTVSHLGQGTTICATNLFRNLPVRQQYHNAARRKKDELKSVETLLFSFSIIHPGVRFTLRHNKELIWQRIPLESSFQALQHVLGKAVTSQMEWNSCSFTDNVKFELCLPKPASDVSSLSRSTSDRSFIFINNRPIVMKELHKLICRYYNNCNACDKARHPVYYLAITIPARDVDVNIAPNKSTIMPANMGIIKERLEEMLARAYETSSGVVSLTKKLPQSNINGTVHLGSGELTEVLYKTSGNTTTNTRSRSRSSGTGPKNTVSSNPESLRSGCSVSGGDSEDALAVSQCIMVRPNNSKLEGCAGGGLVESCVDEIPHTSYNQSGELVSTVFGGVRLKGVSDCNLPAGELKSIALKIPPVPSSDSSKSGCRPIHLEGGVREESVNDIVVSEWLNGFSVLPSPPVAFGSHGQHGCGSETDATPMAAPSRQPVMLGVSESLLTWSCGRSVKSVNGAILQPVSLLLPSTSSNLGKHPPRGDSDDDDSTQNHHANKRLRKQLLTQSVLSDSMDGIELRKPMSAKELFFKEQRAQVVVQNPLSRYDQVTEILATQWSDTPNDVAIMYRDKSWKKKQRYDKQVAVATKVKSSLSESVMGKKLWSAYSKRCSSKPISVRDMLAASSTQPGVRSSTCGTPPTETLTFTLSDMKGLSLQQRQHQCSSQTSIPELDIIGRVFSGQAWLCSKGPELCLLNVHRMAEMTEFHRLLSEYCLPAHIRKNPLSLNSRNLGTSSWKVIENLAGIAASATRTSTSSSIPTCVHLSDVRLLSNGFDVKCFWDVHGQIQAVLVGLCEEVPIYNVQDLVEVLHTIADHPLSGLAGARPLKVINYLKGEAVRRVRGYTGERSKQDVQELLDIMKHLPGTSSVCLHRRPIFHSLSPNIDIAVTSPMNTVASEFT